MVTKLQQKPLLCRSFGKLKVKQIYRLKTCGSQHTHKSLMTCVLLFLFSFKRCPFSSDPTFFSTFALTDRSATRSWAIQVTVKNLGSMSDNQQLSQTEEAPERAKRLSTIPISRLCLMFCNKFFPLLNQSATFQNVSPCKKAVFPSLATDNTFTSRHKTCQK